VSGNVGILDLDRFVQSLALNPLCGKGAAFAAVR